MKQTRPDILNRTRRLLTADKSGCAPLRLSEMLKSDLAHILSDYMDLEKLSVETEFDDTGNCRITITALASRLKTAITIPMQ